MKKIVICIMAACLSLTFFPLASNAATTDTPSNLISTKPVVPVDSAEAKVLLLRLNEIKEMDKSDMKAAEKKAIRKEVKDISNILGEPYIYISGTAILIIILLIILL